MSADNYKINRHRVGLERVQRCHLDIDCEPMEFSEFTIAAMLQDLADGWPETHFAFVMRGLANALRGEDDNHKLILKRAKQGKWRSPADREIQSRRHIAWTLRVERLQKQGWPKDAAVHRIAETTSFSVATIYAGLAERDAFARVARSIADFHSRVGTRMPTLNESEIS